MLPSLTIIFKQFLAASGLFVKFVFLKVYSYWLFRYFVTRINSQNRAMDTQRGGFILMNHFGKSYELWWMILIDRVQWYSSFCGSAGCRECLHGVISRSVTIDSQRNVFEGVSVNANLNPFRCSCSLASLKTLKWLIWYEPWIREIYIPFLSNFHQSYVIRYKSAKKRQ